MLATHNHVNPEKGKSELFLQIADISHCREEFKSSLNNPLILIADRDFQCCGLLGRNTELEVGRWENTDAFTSSFVVIFLTIELASCSSFLITFFFFCFLVPNLRHMEVPRLEVKSELQLPAYTTATEMSDPTPQPQKCHVCQLHHSSQQCQILNPLSEARDQTHNLGS